METRFSDLWIRCGGALVVMRTPADLCRLLIKYGSTPQVSVAVPRRAVVLCRACNPGCSGNHSDGHGLIEYLGLGGERPSGSFLVLAEVVEIDARLLWPGG